MFPQSPEIREAELSAYKTIGQQLGAELLTGLGQFKAGHGAIVTEWHATAEGALREFCELSGQTALRRALRNWMEWRNPLTSAHLTAIHDLCGPAADTKVEGALVAWIMTPSDETTESLVTAITRANSLVS